MFYGVFVLHFPFFLTPFAFCTALTRIAVSLAANGHDLPQAGRLQGIPPSARTHFLANPIRQWRHVTVTTLHLGANAAGIRPIKAAQHERVLLSPASRFAAGPPVGATGGKAAEHLLCDITPSASIGLHRFRNE